MEDTSRLRTKTEVGILPVLENGGYLMDQAIKGDVQYAASLKCQRQVKALQ